MNPSWDLIPFNQLCRILARKTGEPADHYARWSRDKIKAELDAFEAELPEEQIEKIRAGLLDRIEGATASIDKRFEDLRKDILDEIAASRRVEREIVVVSPHAPEGVALPRQHKDFVTLLSLLATGQNVFLVGPAGSGKTSAAMAVAKALDRKFYFNGAIDSEYKLLGFTDAQGRIVSRPFREAWINGGLYLFDELDASLASAALAFNAALANSVCDFPDGIYERHKDFVCVAAGNTFYGADHLYVGRTKQDAAFLDRFLVLDWHYDTDLEKDLALDLWPQEAVKAASWVKMVILVREQAALKGLHIVVSPRASLGGVKLLRAGLPWEVAVRVTLRKTMKASDWEKIQEFTEEQAKPPPPPPKASEPWDDRPVYKAPKYSGKPFTVKHKGQTKKQFYNDLL